MDHATSTAVSEVLDAIVRDFGTTKISAKNAETIFAGDEATTVAELSQHQLMQLTICQLRDLVAELQHIIEGQKHIIQARTKSKFKW